MVDCGQARTGHTILCMPYKHENNETDDVLVFGGGDNNDNFFQDLTRLKIPFETALWYYAPFTWSNSNIKLYMYVYNFFMLCTFYII